MRKALGILLVFIIGIGVGYALLRNVGAASETQAQRNVIGILDRPAARVSTGDTELIQAAAKIEPAVVNIDIVGERRTQVVNPFGEPLERLYMLEGKGSGVVISPDGYVVTNNHVIEGANIIRVTTQNGRKYDGRVIGADPNADLAVVKIDGRDLPAAELGDSSTLKVGQYVIAIGYPLGIGTTVTHGIISATDRRDLPVGEGRILRLALQTDAPINRGNSGGALANTAGQLIGINTAIASENGGGSIGIGFAIPINAARGIIKELVVKGRTAPAGPDQPFVGIFYQPLSADVASQFGLQPGHGVVVVNVLPLTPAESAGLKRGDIIVGVDGKPITSDQDVRNAIVKHGIGGKITFQLLRGDGSKDNVSLTIGHKPPGLSQ